MMPIVLQKQYGCVSEKDLPAPVIDHKAARERVLPAYTETQEQHRGSESVSTNWPKDPGSVCPDTAGVEAAGEGLSGTGPWTPLMLMTASVKHTVVQGSVMGSPLWPIQQIQSV